MLIRTYSYHPPEKPPEALPDGRCLRWERAHVSTNCGRCAQGIRGVCGESGVYEVSTNLPSQPISVRKVRGLKNSEGRLHLVVMRRTWWNSHTKQSLIDLSFILATSPSEPAGKTRMGSMSLDGDTTRYVHLHTTEMPYAYTNEPMN
jgi:hypothetical protein